MGWGSHLGANVKAGLRPVVDLVYPPRCPMCGDAIADQGGLCVECWGELEVPGEPACAACSRPMAAESARGSGRCALCELNPPRHSGISAATIYNDASRKLILTFKHGGKIALAPLLGRLMAGRLPMPDGDVLPLLIPVPLHRWRLWQRGFNQAALLARELERAGKGELLVDGLIRHKRTPSLGGLGREERERALAGAIRLRSSRAAVVEGRDIILVDDVLTSGATAEACVNTLLDGRAKSVRIACFARVLSGSDAAFVADAAEKAPPQNETPEAITAPGAT